MKNKGSEYLRNKAKVMEEERIKPREIRSYQDLKSGVVVHVFAGVDDKPFKSLPVGWSE